MTKIFGPSNAKGNMTFQKCQFFPKTLLFFNEAQVNYCQNLTKTLNSARKAFTEYFSVTLMQRIFLHVNLKLQLLSQRIDNT